MIPTIRVNEVKLNIEDDISELKVKLSKILKVNQNDIIDYKIFRESIDARKAEIQFSYVVDVKLTNEKIAKKKIDNRKISLTPDIEYKFVKKGNLLLKNRPVIVGFGPAGMFAGLILAQMGYKPIIIERGSDVDTRTNKVNEFWNNGRFNANTNVQFGEGGAGTFSDGKLTTRIKDVVRCNKVLKEFVNHGAPDEIIYKQKPHIGTDILKNVVKSLREEIKKLGGTVLFDSKLEEICVNNNRINGIKIRKTSGELEQINTETLILAIGHSARDTFKMLYDNGMDMSQKPFAMGVRIEHLQRMIDESQYGSYAGNSKLGPADYKLVYHCKNGRTVYSFCMCPGGEVIAASSEEGMVVTNGMSEYKRDKLNANSAMLVSVLPADFETDHPLAGIEFQRKWEKAAFNIAGRNYKAPCQLAGDFMEDKKSKCFREIKPTYAPGVQFAMIRECMPTFVTEAIKEAMPDFERKIKGYSRPEAIMTAVETRSSSPVRLLRNDVMVSSIEGIYPCGEGAGYAGGIVSAAVDGIKAAEQIAGVYFCS